MLELHMEEDQFHLIVQLADNHQIIQLAMKKIIYISICLMLIANTMSAQIGTKPQKTLNLPLPMETFGFVVVGIEDKYRSPPIRIDDPEMELEYFTPDQTILIRSYHIDELVNILNKQPKTPKADKQQGDWVARMHIVLYFYKDRKLFSRIRISQMGEITDGKNQYQMNEDLANYFRSIFPPHIAKMSIMDNTFPRHYDKQ